ncbi:hypothetical protein ACNFJ7_15375 [Sphingomonas sp. HT-1]|jgi:hypothetical protein|uniref:hypothetical protein n=1 Tax=unclassified Sphingomonas TaxID=196159 RepID=UPI0002D61D91|nr:MULTISPECIES: hypothetical protein [unclassified Sphingomonas]KTF70762.1 hypothetical protein ATB93_00150 [Sphingomonas sp. WG]
MRNAPYADWMKIGIDSWMLGWEASTVIGLRMAKLAAGGPAASAEAQRMIAEKMQAAFELQVAATTGKLGSTPHAQASKALLHYRRKVRANAKRLG